MSTVFREPDSTEQEAGTVEREEAGLEEKVAELEPATDRTILDSLGVEYGLETLTEGDKENFHEVKNYLFNYMAKKGLPKTSGGVKKALQVAKKDFGLDEEADSQSVIERIGSVAKSYRSLSFIKGLEERKEVLTKLLLSKSTEEMDRIIFELMEKEKVWHL